MLGPGDEGSEQSVWIMSGVTEIYICQPGQPLKEGELVMSSDVQTREQAQRDAKSRCHLDRSIARIVYYAIRPDGDFRAIYSYENPNTRSPKAARPLVADVSFGPAPKFRRRQPPPTLFGRLRALFETN